jgi:hypothetical protein
MNISTGGPHVLLFERDQQFASLLISEFQLAGYECHTARTAVEVFDAIARQPIRIVLVNLAQAAAARREFWVALDTQRRGRGVQVLTFRCSNIAGYGPHDPDDRSQTMVDVEIDGMFGIINLIDIVRTRVPSITSSTNTMPRMPRAATPSPTTSFSQPVQPKAPAAPSTASFSNGHTARPGSDPIHPVQKPNPAAPPPAPSMGSLSSQETSPTLPGGTINTGQSTYSDKIRAVLYPNQRTWTTQGNNTLSNLQDNRQPPYDSPAPNPIPPTNAVSSEATALQRLAGGHLDIDTPKESGLAQLSRMLQEKQAPSPDYVPTGNPHHQRQDTTRLGEESRFIALNSANNQAAPTIQPVNYTPSPPRATSNPDNTFIGAQSLRASPIQDIPVERSATGQIIAEGARKTDASPRPTYGQQAPSPAAIPPLASIGTPTPAAPPRGQISPSLPTEKEVHLETSHHSLDELNGNEQQKERSPALEQTHGELSPLSEQNRDLETRMATNNAVLLDIMQSLPPMPPPPQPPQLQVLSGRATRSLESVLLAGHLVPQSRLEVAQHIQRMLRGVDLNYQLGEILLMFKLLTPDQLLAASLVSYGLITTAQISALGRIRQELHSIGLEYDLENLLILFRILTPEQLREVKTSWQG